MLDILAGRKIGRGIRGTITVNGKPVTAKISGQYFSYVAQEDVFVATLSVWEALMFYTELSLPGDFTTEQRKGRMRAVLRTMGLEKVTKSMVNVYTDGMAYLCLTDHHHLKCYLCKLHHQLASAELLALHR